MTFEPRVTTQITPQEPPPASERKTIFNWIRTNLFNTPFNSVLSIVVLVALVSVVRGTLGFLLADERMWFVIPRNSKLYSTAAYPVEDLENIWYSVAFVAILVGGFLSLRPLANGFRFTAIKRALRSIGVVLVLYGLLAPSLIVVVIVLGVVLAVLAHLSIPDDDSDQRELPLMVLVVAALALVTALLWTLPIAESTALPWTVVFLVMLGSYAVFLAVKRRAGPTPVKRVLWTLSLLAVPIVYLIIQRDPVGVGSELSRILPWIGGLLLFGAAILWIVPTMSKDAAALINTGIVILAAGAWLISMPMFARTAMLLLVVFSLAAPTFASGEGGRIRATVGWALLVLLLGYMFAAGSAEPGLQTRNEYLGGLNVTFLVAISGMILAFPLGITLALGRTSTMPIFRLLSTAYIETIRGVPLITVLFFGQLVIPQFLPTDFEVESIVRAIIAVGMFAAAYLAENVRGGLQSIPKGQYEAAKAMGMTTAQMTLLITLPQALRAVIPAIVGQAIVLFKDTSLLTIIGITDFFDVARQVVPNQPENLGSLLENLVFAAAIYWIFTFSFSRASLRLEKRLGIGTR